MTAAAPSSWTRSRSPASADGRRGEKPEPGRGTSGCARPQLEVLPAADGRDLSRLQDVGAGKGDVVEVVRIQTHPRRPVLPGPVSLRSGAHGGLLSFWPATPSRPTSPAIGDRDATESQGQR